jgi:hypothetical protein
MKKELTILITIISILFMGSCATSNRSAQLIDQNDDVYYSIAQAKEEAEVIVMAKPKADYVTDEELYRDYYGNSSGQYGERIYRFRNYTPWRGYYNNYNNNSFNSYSYYDPYYSPYSLYGNSDINIFVGMGSGYYNYNPWRHYGSNYSNNFWGPYSYNRSFNPYNVGFGGGSYYGSGYGASRPGNVSPNYRPRPSRGSDDLPIDRGAVKGGAGSVGRNGNGNVIQSTGTRSERYNGGNSTSGSSGNSRPQATAPRPERVQPAEPQRSVQPERINSTPSNNNGGSGSNDSGSSSGARPSRGN